MPNTDFRVQLSWLRHEKRRKLIKALGHRGESAMLEIWGYCADASIKGVVCDDSPDELAETIRWRGDDRELYDVMIGLRLLDSVGGKLVVHDWDDHQPWASRADARSEAARKGAAARWGTRPASEPDAKPSEPESEPDAGSNAVRMRPALPGASDPQCPFPFLTLPFLSRETVFRAMMKKLLNEHNRVWGKKRTVISDRAEKDAGKWLERGATEADLFAAVRGHRRSPATRDDGVVYDKLHHAFTQGNFERFVELGGKAEATRPEHQPFTAPGDGRTEGKQCQTSQLSSA